MKTTLQGNRDRIEVWSEFHPIDAGDRAAMVAMRAIVEPNKGRLEGTAARVPFDGIMGGVAPPEGVIYKTGNVGGIPGVWCRPEMRAPEKPCCISMVDGSTGASGYWRDPSRQCSTVHFLR